MDLIWGGTIYIYIYLSVDGCGGLWLVAFYYIFIEIHKSVHVRSKPCALQRMALHQTLQGIAPSSNGLGNEKTN